MKAIHNGVTRSVTKRIAVNYTQRYKKWKQFTTLLRAARELPQLWTIHKDTKNESNSQLNLWLNTDIWSCELYTKIQKMKAIHNQGAGGVGELLAVNYTQRYKKWKQFTTPLKTSPAVWALWTIHKDTKNESNSQRTYRASSPSACCELYTKIQKMKAIHNRIIGAVFEV